MKTRSENLNRLVIGSECEAPWDEMQGDERRRFCSRCQRDVLDFEQLTARQIRGHIEASRGRLCARLTRQAGRLSVLEPVKPRALPRSWVLRRASPIAATLVSAWLGAGAVGAQPSPSSAPATGSPHDGSGAEPERSEARQPALAGRPGAAALHGRIVDGEGAPLPGVSVVGRNALDGREHTTVTTADGAFSFRALAAGVYDLIGDIPEFEVDSKSGISLQPGEDRSVDLTATFSRGEVTAGVLAVSQEPLRRQFDDSELVVAARVGPSVVVGRSGELTEVATELWIESILKGTVSGSRVTYRHSEYLGAPSEENEPAADLVPESRVLAFLKESEETDGPSGRPAFESADYGFGVRKLTDAERSAYVERLEALARLQRKAARHGEVDPSDLMEWLVATAEDPYTRGEVTREISYALFALSERAAKEGTTMELAAQDLQSVVDRFRAAGGRISEEPRPELLGASMTEAQRKRLTVALRATESLEGADFDLFYIVRIWDEESAITWLARQLRTVKPKSGDSEELWRFSALAEELDNEALRALSDAAEAREEEIGKLWPEDESKETEARREKERTALREELRRHFAEVLAGSR